MKCTHQKEEGTGDKAEYEGLDSEKDGEVEHSEVRVVHDDDEAAETTDKWEN